MTRTVLFLVVLIALSTACGGGLIPELGPLPQETPGPTLGAWKLYDPRDSSLKDLFAAKDDGYALVPGWEVQTVEYVFKWWGLSPEPVFDYQKVERGDSSFGGKAAQVQALLDGLARLHPSQMLLAGQGHTDDYPSWALEVLGTDGQRVLIMSSSTDNPGSGPWNVYYNGRMYAQYDGTLGSRIAGLFDSPSGSPAAAYYPGGYKPGTSRFSTQGWPAQLTSGFTGLLAIADDFQYGAVADKSEIQGTLIGRSSIGSYGNMVIGRVTALTKVALAAADGTTINCTIEGLPSDDPVGAGWKFSCPAGTAPMTGTYRYGIAVQFGTDKGEILTSTGELRGTWDESFPVLPLPAELQAALAGNSDAQDLLHDHVPAYALYSATIDAREGPVSGTVSGELVLMGQVQANGRAVRYTVGTPFALEDGKLVRWALTRAAVQSLANEVAGLALTGRVLEAKPDALVNLWYAETGTRVEAGPSLGGYQRDYELDLVSCGSIPGAGRYPAPDRPLRAFGYESSWAFWMADFVLADGQAVVADLDLWPARGEREELLPVLLPKALDTGDTRPFERVWMSRSSSFSRYIARLTLWIAEDATAGDKVAYDRLAGALPVTVSKEYETLWEATGMTYVVATNGMLEVVACK